MTTKEVLEALESLGNEKTYAQNKKQGASDKQFGVKLGDIRALSKKIKTNHALALALWKTENIDARFLSTLIIQPKAL
jgi:3-methyladenine DNA glycosylase AlkD